MKNKIKLSRFFILFLIFFKMGCLQTRAELNDKNNYQASHSQTAQMQQSHKVQQDLLNRPQELEESMRVLMGKIGEMEHRIDKLEQQSEGLLNQSKKIQELSESAKKVDDLTDELKNQKLKIEILEEKMSKPIETKEPAVTKSSWDSAEALFEKSEYQKAILEYQKYREQNPKSKKLAEATYKIGYSFEKLGMKAEAKSFYLEVTENYKKSTEAKKAQIRLKKIK